MKAEVFVDTSGFYALLVKKDNQHEAARGFMKRAASQRRAFVTTDYVLDETATVLKARGYAVLVDQLFEAVLSSRVCRVEWMDTQWFQKVRGFFGKHLDHSWSFTDCFSFVLMKALGLSEALTKDSHFREAGYVPLLME